MPLNELTAEVILKRKLEPTFKYEGKNSRYTGSQGMRKEVGKQSENQILQTLAIYKIPTECECTTNKNRQMNESLNIQTRNAGVR